MIPRLNDALFDYLIQATQHPLVYGDCHCPEPASGRVNMWLDKALQCFNITWHFTTATHEQGGTLNIILTSNDNPRFSSQVAACMICLGDYCIVPRHLHAAGERSLIVN
jgi:hypothetical protein